MMSITKSEEDTKSVWRNKNSIDKTNTYDKDFPPLPTMEKIYQHISIHIVLHHPYHQ